MLEVYGESIFDLIQALSRRSTWDVIVPDDNDFNRPLKEVVGKRQIFRDYVDNALIDLETLRAGFKALGAKFTDKLAEEFETDLREGNCSRANTFRVWEEIRSRLRHELSETSFWLLENKFKEYLITPDDASPKPKLFAPEIVQKFPSADYEIEEAIACLGFERSTAAVFHLMRVLEIGVRALSKCLSIPDPVKDAERNWGVMLKNIKTELDRRASSLSKDDRMLLYEIYASLDAVRNVWRNATMHVEAKYLPVEAEHICYAVRGFMAKLSSRMDESGEPKA